MPSRDKDIFPNLWMQVMTKTPAQLVETVDVGYTRGVGPSQRFVSLEEALTWPIADVISTLAESQSHYKSVDVYNRHVAHYTGMYERYAPPERAIPAMFLASEMRPSEPYVTINGVSVVCHIAFRAEIPWPAAMIVDATEDFTDADTATDTFIGLFMSADGEIQQRVTAEEAINTGVAACLPAALCAWAETHHVQGLVAALLADCDPGSAADLHRLACRMNSFSRYVSPCDGCLLQIPNHSRVFQLQRFVVW